MCLSTRQQHLHTYTVILCERDLWVGEREKKYDGFEIKSMSTNRREGERVCERVHGKFIGGGIVPKL